MILRKKLIEVSIPLETINKFAVIEKNNPFLKGHPRTLHQWWARRPHGAARALIFAQMVDDPSSHPELFPTKEAQDLERIRLFKIIEELSVWENSSKKSLFDRAYREIQRSWELTCKENEGSLEKSRLFDNKFLPNFYDPFCGGGSLPLEAQRLGLKSFASDLNPIPVLINKALIEIPPKFKNQDSVNPESQNQKKQMDKSWQGAQGLADDIRYYGKWINQKAKEAIGSLYPEVEITDEMIEGQPDLKYLLGKKINVIAWLWARTVKSSNPAFSNIEVPLASTFVLSEKKGNETYVVPIINSKGYKFSVQSKNLDDFKKAKSGTKIGRGANFICVMSNSPMESSYVRNEFQNNKSKVKMIALVAEGEKTGRIFLTPTVEIEKIALTIEPDWLPEQEMNQNSSNLVSGRGYGVSHWHQIFTPRQIVTLTTFANLIEKLKNQIRLDAINAGHKDDQIGLEHNGRGALAYAESICLVVALSIDKLADYSNTVCSWNQKNQNITHLFSKQAIPMAWDYVENAALNSGFSIENITESIAKSFESLPANIEGKAFQQDCSLIEPSERMAVISTDPPYYDNIAYADLSDFFYIWLRKSLKPIFPNLFSTLAVPKMEELTAMSYRHGGQREAEEFFLTGMTKALTKISECSHPAFPVTIYYAFKQSEHNEKNGVSNTGWVTFLNAIIKSGFLISGTWPIRTERIERSVGIGNNALASSIVLVCRKRSQDNLVISRREFISELKTELTKDLIYLQQGNIAPVDLAQAALGPGMAIFTRYTKIIDASGEPILTKDAIVLINQVLDETFAEAESNFDSDTRWAITWFDQFAFDDGEFGIAEQLSKSKNTSVSGLEQAGILAQGNGKVRLLKFDELLEDWDPDTDKRLTIWETLHYLIRLIEASGEAGAAKLYTQLGDKAEGARELAYRLYAICEKRKRAAEAQFYNSIVQSWPEIQRLSKEQNQFVLTSTENIKFEGN